MTATTVRIVRPHRVSASSTSRGPNGCGRAGSGWKRNESTGRGSRSESMFPPLGEGGPVGRVLRTLADADEGCVDLRREGEHELEVLSPGQRLFLARPFGNRHVVEAEADTRGV